MWRERLPDTYEMFVRDGYNSDLFEGLIANWVAAGGDPEESAKRYLMGTGRLRATKARFELLCEKTKSALEEIKQVGLKWPQLPLP